MSQSSITDQMWSIIEPMLPEHGRSAKGGRPAKDDRMCLEGIVHVLRTGTQWQQLPKSPSWPSGSTCYRRFDQWTKAGIWPQLHRELLNVLNKAGQIDLSNVVIDSASVRAEKGGPIPGPVRSIGGKTAANGTFFPTPTAHHC